MYANRSRKAAETASSGDAVSTCEESIAASSLSRGVNTSTRQAVFADRLRVREGDCLNGRKSGCRNAAINIHSPGELAYNTPSGDKRVSIGNASSNAANCFCKQRVVYTKISFSFARVSATYQTRKSSARPSCRRADFTPANGKVLCLVFSFSSRSCRPMPAVAWNKSLAFLSS